MSHAVDAVAFTLPAGAVSDPISTDNGAVIVKVLERKDITDAEMKMGGTSCAISSSARSATASSVQYMAKAREKMRINRNEATIAQVIA